MKHQDASTGAIVEDGQAAPSNSVLQIKIYSPFKIYFDGSAESLTAENDTGQFDVLLGHKNFLSLLNPCDIVIRQPGGAEEKISITRGIIHVHNDAIKVFLDV